MLIRDPYFASDRREPLEFFLLRLYAQYRKKRRQNLSELQKESLNVNHYVTIVFQVPRQLNRKDRKYDIDRMYVSDFQ